VSGKTTSIPLRLELRQPRCCDASIRPIRLEASCHVLILGGFGQNTGGFGQPAQQNTGGGLFGGGGTAINTGFGEYFSSRITIYLLTLLVHQAVAAVSAALYLNSSRTMLLVPDLPSVRLARPSGRPIVRPSPSRGPELTPLSRWRRFIRQH